jgi:hypothetical protein
MVTSPQGALRFEFSIQGDVEMQNTLRRLGHVVSEKIMRKALREGAKVLTQAARQNLRRRGVGRGAGGRYVSLNKKRTGQLAASIGTRVKLYAHSGTGVAIWGCRRGGKYGERSRLAHLVEFGHKNVLAAQVRAAAAKMGVKFR